MIVCNIIIIRYSIGYIIINSWLCVFWDCSDSLKQPHITQSKSNICYLSQMSSLTSHPCHTLGLLIKRTKFKTGIFIGWFGVWMYLCENRATSVIRIFTSDEKYPSSLRIYLYHCSMHIVCIFIMHTMNQYEFSYMTVHLPISNLEITLTFLNLHCKWLQEI